MIEHKFSNSELEDISIGVIEKLCRLTRRIKSNIEKGSTVPSWDGELYFYEDDAFKVDFSKDKLIKKIPIQIKATQVKKNNEKLCSFPMDVSDLRNYYKNESTILFLVQIVDFENYKIFYKDLLPSNLKEIIDQINQENKNRKEKNTYHGKEQQEKTIYLEELEEKPEFLSSLLESFSINSNMQSTSLVELGYSEKDISEKIVMSFKPSYENNKFTNKSFYLYSQEGVKESEKQICIPVSGEYVLYKVIRNCYKKVMVGNKIFYYYFKISFSEGETIYHLNNYIDLYIEKYEIYIFKASGRLNDYIKNLEFQLAIIENPYLILGMSTINLKYTNIYIRKEGVLCELDAYRDLEKLLKILGLNQEYFLLEDISENQFFNINYLIKSFVKKEGIKKIGFPREGLYEIQMGKHNLLFEEYYDAKTKKSYLINILGDPNKNKKYNNGQYYSPYLLLPSKYMSYFNYNLIKSLESISNVINPDNQYISFVSHYIEELIRYYDSFKDKKYLDTALSLCEWIIKLNYKNEFMIKKYLILKRVRTFTAQEILQINELKKVSTSRYFHFMIYVLLDDLDNQKKLIEDLTDIDIFILNINSVGSLTKLKWRVIDMESVIDDLKNN